MNVLQNKPLIKYSLILFLIAGLCCVKYSLSAPREDGKKQVVKSQVAKETIPNPPVQEQEEIAIEPIDDIFQPITEEEKREMRRAEIQAIWNEKELTDELFEKLLSALRDNDWEIREAAWGNLIHFGEPALLKIVALGIDIVPYLVKSLNCDFEEYRLAAAETIVKISQNDPDVVRYLVGRLEYYDENVSYPLGIIGRPAIHLLIEALSSDNETTRGNAAAAFSEMTCEHNDAIPFLIKSLKDWNAKVRYMAAEAIGKIGERASEAAPILFAMLEDDDLSVRCFAAEALGNMGERGKIAVPKLIEMVKNKDSGEEQSAAKALGNLGLEQADSVIPVLVAALERGPRDG
jgi:HEAT repeat protein